MPRLCGPGRPVRLRSSNTSPLASAGGTAMPVPAVSASAEAPAAITCRRVGPARRAPPSSMPPLLCRLEHAAKSPQRLEAPHDRRLTPACSSRDSAATEFTPAAAIAATYRPSACFQSTEPTRPGPRARTPARRRRAAPQSLPGAPRHLLSPDPAGRGIPDCARPSRAHQQLFSRTQRPRAARRLLAPIPIRPGPRSAKPRAPAIRPAPASATT